MGAALSMVYVTGQPVVFVGCGQKYAGRKMTAALMISWCSCWAASFVRFLPPFASPPCASLVLVAA